MVFDKAVVKAGHALRGILGFSLESSHRNMLKQLIRVGVILVFKDSWVPVNSDERELEQRDHILITWNDEATSTSLGPVTD